MININYYDKNGKQVAKDVMMTGKLSTELLKLTYEKCILLEFYSYIADDDAGNHIKETVLEDEDNYAEDLKQPRKSGGKCKPIAQYTEDGKLLNVWSSACEASCELGFGWSTIGNAARESRKSHGFIWKYVEDDMNEEI